MIETLLTKSQMVVRTQKMDFVRSLSVRIDWRDRLIGVVGARGTGKTTLLLQHLKTHHKTGQTGMYISLDDVFFTEHKLVDVADVFYQRGGRALYIDEVHKYPNWAQEIKNLYDFYRDLSIVYTGSSIVDIIREYADLSRRSVQYELSGLSFREFLIFEGHGQIEAISLEELINNHQNAAHEISEKIKPLMFFQDYLHHGYYPFYKENTGTYLIRVEQMIKRVLESDFQAIEGFDPHNIRKVLQLLFILAMNVPFKPNITRLAERTGIYRTTLINYLQYLERARLVNFLVSAGKSLGSLQKPDKLYLENTNLMHSLSTEKPEKGTERETFFLNQLKNAGHRVSLPQTGDFLVDDKWIFEVGGRSKTSHQIQGLKNAFIAADDIEAGVYNRIPLWLFGFLE